MSRDILAINWHTHFAIHTDTFELLQGLLIASTHYFAITEAFSNLDFNLILVIAICPQISIISLTCESTNRLTCCT
jgi:hypothetical protein